MPLAKYSCARFWRSANRRSSLLVRSMSKISLPVLRLLEISILDLILARHPAIGGSVSSQLPIPLRQSGNKELYAKSKLSADSLITGSRVISFSVSGHLPKNCLLGVEKYEGLPDPCYARSSLEARSQKTGAERIRPGPESGPNRMRGLITCRQPKRKGARLVPAHKALSVARFDRPKQRPLAALSRPGARGADGASVQWGRSDDTGRMQR
jgi:hypothetical protein